MTLKPNTNNKTKLTSYFPILLWYMDGCINLVSIDISFILLLYLYITNRPATHKTYKPIKQCDIFYLLCVSWNPIVFCLINRRFPPKSLAILSFSTICRFGDIMFASVFPRITRLFIKCSYNELSPDHVLPCRSLPIIFGLKYSTIIYFSHCFQL